MKPEHLSDFSDEQISNLEKLADFLMSSMIPPPRFDMATFFQISNETYEKYHTLYSFDVAKKHPEVYNECGTTACAVGHGPLAGIPLEEYEKSWANYCDRAFCPMECRDEFNFMFGGAWRDKNNTAKGTSNRIRYFLKNGVPESLIIPDITDNQSWEEYNDLIYNADNIPFFTWNDELVIDTIEESV